MPTATNRLRLDLLDVRGNRLQERVDVVLRHQTLASEDRIAKAVDARKSIVIDKLMGTPQGLYWVEVDPPSYLRVSRAVNVAAGKVTPLELRFPVDPAKVRAVKFPDFASLEPDVQQLLERSSTVFAFENRRGADLYAALDDIRRAGFLNIVAKCKATRLSGEGETVFAHLSELRELRGDRFFALVTKHLREDVKTLTAEGRFRAVDGALHKPPANFEPAGSFKSEDSYGNLQLTFFVQGDTWVADIDIDDAAGLAHVFQVARNELTGRPTHPYDIREILIAWQGTDPGYTFEV